MLLQDLFHAYYDARRNKRNTINALQFEYNYEHELFKLYQEVKERRYTLKRSICFINHYPVKREIFASDFRDRIIHHFIYNHIYHIFERIFIHDAYSCRQGKGTLFGIKRLDKFIRSCSQNYKKDCYILKLDISGYFMNIDKVLLYRKVESVLARYKKHIQGTDLDLLLYLIRKVICDDPTKQCYIRGNRDEWQGLPRDKSLFYSGENKGLPIGNLTSQLFSNVYLNDFDRYMKHILGCHYYGRYVDDFCVVSESKTFLKQVIQQADEYLKKYCCLQVHKNKIYLQHFSRGVDFLGSYLKPGRIYIKNRTKGNLYKVIHEWNEKFKETFANVHISRATNLSLLEEETPKTKGEYRPTREEVFELISRVNSYLGMMSHFKTVQLRRRAIERIDIRTFNWVCVKNFSNRSLEIRERVFYS